MTDAPKCKSWFGHKFEARYSLGPARSLSETELFWLMGYDRLPAIKASRRQTYECDVCVRCGHVVQPPPEISGTTRA